MEGHVKPKEMWEIGREWNPEHRIFWIDVVFFLGCGLFATWQVFEYATAKAHAANKGYLFTGAHNLWRVVASCAVAAILLICELFMPGHKPMHFVIVLALLLDAALFYIHVEKYSMPVLFPIVEALFTSLIAIGMSDKGRMTTPILLLMASFRLAAEFWPLSQDEDAFKIVSATLSAALAWHWFPLFEAMNLFNDKQAHSATNSQMEYQYATAVNLIFLSNVILGHLSVLALIWRIFPQAFRSDFAYEMQMQERPGA